MVQKESSPKIFWGDVATAFHSTGVGNITVYFRRTKLFRSADILGKLLTKFDPKMDVRSEFPRFSSEDIAANMPIVDFLRPFSEKKNATPAQISLAWLLAQKPFLVPIPGTRSAEHLHENLRAVDVQLTPADLGEIETDLSKIEVHGGRMNEERMMAVDQTV